MHLTWWQWVLIAYAGCELIGLPFSLALGRMAARTDPERDR